MRPGEARAARFPYFEEVAAGTLPGVAAAVPFWVGSFLACFLAVPAEPGARKLSFESVWGGVRGPPPAAFAPGIRMRRRTGTPAGCRVASRDSRKRTMRPLNSAMVIIAEFIGMLAGRLVLKVGWGGHRGQVQAAAEGRRAVLRYGRTVTEFMLRGRDET